MRMPKIHLYHSGPKLSVWFSAIVCPRYSVQKYIVGAYVNHKVENFSDTPNS